MSRGRDGLWRAILPRGGSTRRTNEHVVKRRAVVRAVSDNTRRRVVRWTRPRQAADRAVDLRLTNRRGRERLSLPPRRTRVIRRVPLAADKATRFAARRRVAERSEHERSRRVINLGRR